MIEYLLQRKFSLYKTLYAYLFRQEDYALRESHERYKRAILAYCDQLHEMPFEELQALYQQELQAKYEQEKQQEELQRFFNWPSANADLTHWSKAAQWTLDEATALSFGKAPEVVNWASVKDLVGLSPFATQYARVLDLAQRAKEQQQLHDPVLPGLFLAWAKRNEFDYPPELEELADWISLYDEQARVFADLKRRYDRIKAQYNENQSLLIAKEMETAKLLKDNDTLRERLAELEIAVQAVKEKPLLTKERQTALKLIIGLVVGVYGRDSWKKGSSIVSDITDDLARDGLKLDPDTVRKWLREAAEVLPPKNSDDQDR